MCCRLSPPGVRQLQIPLRVGKMSAILRVGVGEGGTFERERDVLAAGRETMIPQIALILEQVSYGC